MNRTSVAIASVGILILLVLVAGPAVPREQRVDEQPVKANSNPPIVSESSTALDTFALGSWTFDDGVGGPDPQGWTSADATYQDTYFHVDDFVGMDPPYAPLEGTKSMWCGLRENCEWFAAPGYGSSWEQYFETTSGFASIGDVTVSFITRYDTEPGYDYTYLEYLSTTGSWQTLTSLGGPGQSFESHTIPGDSLGGTAHLRFRFISDGAFEDQSGLWPTDGAIVIDSLLVRDASGTVDYQDFESEAVDALVTTDGDWQCRARDAFGDFAGLFDGSTVVQEDSLITNNTYLWGFFNGSAADYSCGGHAGQAAVPFTSNPGSSARYDYIHNEVWSPWVEFTEDVNGDYIPSNSSLVYEFDVYRDLPLDNVVYYTFRVRFMVDGCPTRWRQLDPVWWGDDKDWYRQVGDFSSFIEEDATHVQLSLAVEDWCRFYCGVSGSGACHSHAPLFDNVELYRVLDPSSSVDDTPSLATKLHQNYPNPFNPSTTIRYTIDVPGNVSLVVYNVAGKRVRTLVDGHQTPSATSFQIQWDGTDDAGRTVSTGIYFYRLETGAFSQTRKMVLLK